MKMIFLKRFNEANKNDEVCDFEDFKELMFDISDYYNCRFYDNIGYYGCVIPTEALDCDQVIRNEPACVGFHNEKDIDMNEIISKIKEIENFSTNLIEYNKKILSVVKTVKEDVAPRFESFSNFYDCKIGIYPDSIQIYFYKKLKK